MSTFDIAIIIILGLGAIKGYFNGFIVEVASFFAFFIGLFLALELTIPVANYFFSGYSDVVAVLVFIGLFILLTFLIRLGAKALKSAINMTLFGTLDNLAGAVAAVFKWAFIISIIIWVFDSVGFDIGRTYANDAIIFPYIVFIGPAVFEWLGFIIPWIRDMIDAMDQLSGPEKLRKT